jgi:hypothetical protein
MQSLVQGHETEDLENLFSAHGATQVLANGFIPEVCAAPFG